jgi:hypothetical protein
MYNRLGGEYASTDFAISQLLTTFVHDRGYYVAKAWKDLFPLLITS